MPKTIPLTKPTSPKKQKKRKRVIDYEYMTPAQKRIVDTGLRPPAGTIPSHLSDEELTKWMTMQIEKHK